MEKNGAFWLFLKLQAPPANRSVAIISPTAGWVGTLRGATQEHCAGIAYKRTAVVGAGAVGLAVPGGLGGEPGGAVGGAGTDGRDEHGEECHKGDGVGGDTGHIGTTVSMNLLRLAGVVPLVFVF
jgi:hypothetical protein